MKLFTAEIDKKLFAQYLKGSDLANQVVVAKIFNPYGRGTWYLLNSDPEDPEYLWAIVDLGDIEVGSVNRSDLENIRIKPFMLGLERDLSFTPMNAAEIYRGLNSGKTYAKGGGVGEYKLKDNVDFYYGRADEKKVISGTITDILNDGYTISTGFTQVMVKPNEIVGYSKQAEPKKKRFGIFKDGGEVNYLIEEEGNDEDRIKISIENIGEAILVVSYPKYEFQEDLTEKEFDKIGLDEEEPIGKIEHIQVDDKEKGKGYAKLLMNKVIEVAKERGMFPLYLNASPMGSRGLNIEDLTEFYKSFGFKVFKKQGNNNLMLLEEKNIKLKKFADGGEITADERMKSLKNYPKLKL